MDSPILLDLERNSKSGSNHILSTGATGLNEKQSNTSESEFEDDFESFKSKKSLTGKPNFSNPNAADQSSRILREYNISGILPSKNLVSIQGMFVGTLYSIVVTISQLQHFHSH